MVIDPISTPPGLSTGQPSLQSSRQTDPSYLVAANPPLPLGNGLDGQPIRRIPLPPSCRGTERQPSTCGEILKQTERGLLERLFDPLQPPWRKIGTDKIKSWLR